MPDPAGNNQSAPPPERGWVAENVVQYVMLTMTVLSTVVLATNWKNAEIVRYVFASIIPLLASWMGTILAFYFSRDSLAAATQSVRDLTQAVTGMDKLKTIPVKDKMRPLKDIKCEKIDPADDKNKKLSDLVQGVERIPILNSQSVLRYLIYKAMIDKYLAQLDRQTFTPDKVAALTLADLLADVTMKKLFESTFAFVSLTATLADAKREMEAIDKCGDVFVTSTGKKDEPILGLITDNTIIENLRV